MAAVRQEPRRSLSGFVTPGVQGQRRLGSPPGRRHSLQWPAPRPEQDGSIGAPGTSCRRPAGQLRDGPWRRTGQIAYIQFALSEEPDRVAVGRPKGLDSVLRAGQRLNGQRIQRAQPQAGLACARRGEDQLCPVRRNRGRVIRHPHSLGRKRNLEARHQGFGRLLAEMDSREREQHKAESGQRDAE